MSLQLQSDKKSNNKKNGRGGVVRARETDPLIHHTGSSSGSSGILRARRSSSRSPVTGQQQRQIQTMTDAVYDEKHDGYESIQDAPLHPQQQQQQHQPQNSSVDEEQQQQPQRQQTYLYNNNNNNNKNSGSSSSPDVQPAESLRGDPSSAAGSVGSGGSQPPLLEIPEEIYMVRKAALQVYKPLTKTWIVISVGFAMTVLFGMARWTRLLPGIPFWFILFPCWASHVGLLWLHVLSARALSAFISEANESRQRPDSRDHLNRTEYLPLLQRSLKFGLKTGLMSFCMFIFEILIYVRLAKGSISVCAALFPLWLLVTGGILDGFICKTQHFLRVLCWVLTFVAMVLLVIKVDHHNDSIRWRAVFSPVIIVLAVASGSLVYIVYGHQIGYYRLTESQLTAGNLYSLAALICIVLVVMIGEVIPLTRPVEIETRLFVVILAPLVVCLVGMGAWVVSRDEFGRLLLYGGQSAVHPMKLRWESKGWTSVQGKGVTVIPMFGEVSFHPLERKPTDKVMEMCACLSGQCYPYEEDQEEESTLLGGDLENHPYLDPSPSYNGKSPFF